MIFKISPTYSKQVSQLLQSLFIVRYIIFLEKKLYLHLIISQHIPIRQKRSEFKPDTNTQFWIAGISSQVPNHRFWFPPNVFILDVFYKNCIRGSCRKTILMNSNVKYHCPPRTPGSIPFSIFIPRYCNPPPLPVKDFTTNFTNLLPMGLSRSKRVALILQPTCNILISLCYYK